MPEPHRLLAHGLPRGVHTFLHSTMYYHGLWRMAARPPVTSPQARATPLALLQPSTVQSRRVLACWTFRPSFVWIWLAMVAVADYDAAAAINVLDPATASPAEVAAENRTMLRYAEFPEFIDSKDKAMGDEIAATFLHRTTRKKSHTVQARGSGLAFLILIETYRSKKARRSVALALEHERKGDATGTGDVGHSQERVRPEPHRHHAHAHTPAPCRFRSADASTSEQPHRWASHIEGSDLAWHLLGFGRVRTTQI